MANPVASVSDLEARSLRPLTDAERSVAQQWLDDSWAILVTQRPFVAQKVLADAVFRSLVSQILCGMVLRVMNNPNGVYQESIDDYAYTRDAAVSTGQLYVSDAELGLIGWEAGGGTGAFSIRAVGNWGRPQPDPWLPLTTTDIP